MKFYTESLIIIRHRLNVRKTMTTEFHTNKGNELALKMAQGWRKSINWISSSTIRSMPWAAFGFLTLLCASSMITAISNFHWKISSLTWDIPALNTNSINCSAWPRITRCGYLRATAMKEKFKLWRRNTSTKNKTTRFLQSLKLASHMRSWKSLAIQILTTKIKSKELLHMGDRQSFNRKDLMKWSFYSMVSVWCSHNTSTKIDEINVISN